MATLRVGQGQAFATISAAVAASHAGDTILVQAGTYTNDFPPSINHNLTLQSVGGMVHMVATSSPPNGKAILDIGGAGVNVTVTGFEFSGAQVGDGNGAGIRYEGGNLTLNACYFHDNQDGMLASSDPSGRITINSSEFSHNGAGDGYTHNLYVNEVGKLTVTGSYFYDAVVGHELKSRADTTVIRNSRFVDGPNGTASYSIDLPNGGTAVISNNVIEQGPHSQNPVIIAYGEEGSLHPGSLTVSNNTILNDLASGSAKAVLNAGGAGAQVSGNRVFGLTSGQILSGPGTVSGTTTLASEPALDASHPWLRLTGTAVADRLQATIGHQTVNAGAGNDTVFVSSSGNVINGQAGADVITITSGTGNRINGGDGQDRITDNSAGGNTIVLATPKSGNTALIYGNVLGKGDKFSVTAALSGTGWNHDLSTAGQYFAVQNNASTGNATIVVKQGAGTYAVATLMHSGPVTLAQFLSHVTA